MAKLTSQGQTSGQFLFRLDHSKPDGKDPWETVWLRSVDGGAIKSAVITESIGALPRPFKHHGPIEVEPITVEVGLGTAGPILDWLQDSWNHKHSYRNGAILHGDFRYRATVEKTIQHALIEEVTFPALDGSDKNPAYLTAKIRAEKIFTQDHMHEIFRDQEFKYERQKLWSPSNFRLDLDGLEAACAHVNKIDSLTIKQKIKALHVGGQRHAELIPVAVEFPSITLTLGAAHAEPFVVWHEQAVASELTEQARKEGAIELLAPTAGPGGGLDDALFRIKLHEVGISSLSFDKSEAGAESIKRCKVELFVDSMTLERGAG